MSTGRWILTAVVTTVVVSIVDMIGHGVVLRGLYLQTAALWRPEAEMVRLSPWGYLATLISTFALVSIFHKGYEGKGSRIAEGLRFGLVVGIFVAVPMAIWSFVTIPMPAAIAAGWFVIPMIDMLVAGVVIALLYRRAVA